MSYTNNVCNKHGAWTGENCPGCVKDAAHDLLEASEAVLECPLPINHSEIAKNGMYVGMFEIHGNRLDLLKQAVDKAKPKAVNLVRGLDT